MSDAQTYVARPFGADSHVMPTIATTGSTDQGCRLVRSSSVCTPKRHTNRVSQRACGSTHTRGNRAKPGSQLIAPPIAGWRGRVTATIDSSVAWLDWSSSTIHHGCKRRRGREIARRHSDVGTACGALERGRVSTTPEVKHDKMPSSACYSPAYAT